jgi:hypothetical protein
MAKKQSFADKASKVKHAVNCPVCGSTIQPVLYVRSAKADSGAWKFRQKVVQVCKCNHAEIYG